MDGMQDYPNKAQDMHSLRITRFPDMLPSEEAELAEDSEEET